MMDDGELAALREAPGDATFRDVRRLVGEVERLGAALERVEEILSPETMRGDQTIDDAYGMVIEALAGSEHRHDPSTCCVCAGSHCCCLCPEGPILTRRPYIVHTVRAGSDDPSDRRI